MLYKKQFKCVAFQNSHYLFKHILPNVPSSYQSHLCHLFHFWEYHISASRSGLSGSYHSYIFNFWKLLKCSLKWLHHFTYLPAIYKVSNFSTSSTTFVSFSFYDYSHSGGGLVTMLCQIHATLWTVACQGPLSIGFSRQEYWSGLPFSPPGDLPNPGIEPRSPAL